MPDLNVDVAGISIKNPVIAASGTYGYGREMQNFVDLDLLGGICVKGLTLEERKGNKPPRIAETPSGILNSVGLQNPGIEGFIKKELPFLKGLNTAVIVNIAGDTIDDYCKIVEKLSETCIDAVELNVSCPNVKKGCAAFGSTPSGVESVTSSVRKKCRKPLFVKLTPNTTDIRQISAAAEQGGADAISLINTITGMAIDPVRRRPVLGNNIGGLSGPAVKPIALRMVYEACKSVRIPVIGMGGIMKGTDAVEFMLAGAAAVMVGTANIVKPTACIDIITGIDRFLEEQCIKRAADLTGKLILN